MSRSGWSCFRDHRFITVYLPQRSTGVQISLLYSCVLEVDRCRYGSCQGSGTDPVVEDRDRRFRPASKHLRLTRLTMYVHTFHTTRHYFNFAIARNSEKYYSTHVKVLEVTYNRCLTGRKTSKTSSSSSSVIGQGGCFLLLSLHPQGYVSLSRWTHRNDPKPSSSSHRFANSPMISIIRQDTAAIYRIIPLL